MSLQFQVSEGGVSDFKEFVSLKLPSAARSWLLKAPLLRFVLGCSRSVSGVFQTNRRAFLEDGR